MPEQISWPPDTPHHLTVPIKAPRVCPDCDRVAHPDHPCPDQGGDAASAEADR